MAKKLMIWKTKGMNRDLSVSAFNPEFAFENMNLRLSTNEGNTLLSWVNEKGPKELKLYKKDIWSKEGEQDVVGKYTNAVAQTLLHGEGSAYTNTADAIADGWSWTEYKETSIEGVPIGTAVLNHKLVIFTANKKNYRDHIYVLSYIDDVKTQMLVTDKYSGDLNFSTSYPLETLVSYESDAIQKVYWVDGKNQPRVINIAAEGLSTKPNTFFDFIPTLQLLEEITVKKILGGNGTFAPGVIQYAFTYYNKYGQESNIFYATPLYYLSHKDRGASPEDKVDNAFKITVNNVDKNFDYLRIYSIQRTSINGTPTCKRIQDIDIQNLVNAGGIPTNTASYTDTGTSGDSIDPTELLYKGGEAIVPNTLEQKDGTLFLGNFRNGRDSLKDLEKDLAHVTSIVSQEEVEGVSQFCLRDIHATEVSTGDYYYANQLTSFDENGNSIPCGGFKHGDWYRCGVQFLHKTGRWSEPLFIGDVMCEGRPRANNNTISLPVLKGVIDVTGSDYYRLLENIVLRGYRKIRPVVVFPELKDRITLCQGVVAPTVYTNDLRGIGTSNTSSLYAQSSWFFRFPYTSQSSQIDTNSGTVSPYFPSVGTNNPIPYMDNGTNASPKSIRAVEIQGCFDDNYKFQVDKNFLTFHSPDVEFDTQLWNTSFYGVNGVQVGTVGISKTLSDISIQTETPTVSTKGGGFDHKSFLKSGAKGIVSGLFYEDFAVDDAGEEGAGGTERDLVAWGYEKSAYKWMVYTWNKDGSLNNDINRPAGMGTPSAILKKKVISNLRITDENNYSMGDPLVGFTTPELYSGDEPTVIKVNSNVYQGNIDTMLVPQKSDGMYFAFPFLATQYVLLTIDPDPGAETSGVSFTENVYWKTFGSLSGENHGIYYWNTDANPDCWTEANAAIGTSFVDLVMKKQGVRMKYKSTPHLVFGISSGLNWVNDTLPIVELQRDPDPNMFGGTSTDALKENNWLPCGEPVPICTWDERTFDRVEFEYSYGDTYYQRWDCLKTYAFTPEDVNLVVEIGSFMLETHVNIDGRYDRNRGQVNNTYMSPRNFNLINDVYSQKDNFFTYKILDDDYYNNILYMNQITWSKTKEAGADVDLWTNITLASVLELDGDKGELNKLIKFNNFLFAFQDTGISQILYNDNVQIQSTQGVPIEIANSGKVSGKDYKSSSVGCSNKWSMVTTPNGVYFMDSNDKSIYLFNGQLTNVSSAGGFNAWCKQSIPSSEVKWDPVNFDNFVGYYDKQNQDVLFINRNIALAWSEKLQSFTSFYDYGNAPFLCSLDDIGVWIKDNVLWKHQAGGYCDFFSSKKPYWMTLIGNPEPQSDKIFTNLEFRACVEGDGEYNANTDKFTPTLPFDSLETWNEYLHGIAHLSIRNGQSLFKHHTKENNASLIRKFRIWRCDIPRDNFGGNGNVFDETFDDTFRGGLRQTHPLDRMRNPWLYLKLKKDWGTEQDEMPKAETHDVVITYYS